MIRLILFSLLSTLCAAAVAAPKRVLVLGDSLAEGYGVAHEAAYPALLEKKLRAAGFNVEVVNGGVSGSTTASAVSRLRWHLRAKPDVVVVELGGNDGLRGVDLNQTEKNLAAVIELAQNQKLKVILAGMKVPPNYGVDYTRQFEKLFPALAKRFQIPLIPFLLEGVGGVPELNQADGIHPNEKGHQRVAENVLPFVEKIL